MEFKDYQQTVLDTLDAYLDELKIQLINAEGVEKIRKANPKLAIAAPDFCGESWEAIRKQDKLPKIRHDKPYSPRVDGIGRAVPNITFKVPTGGGKTLLATASVSRIFGNLLNTNTGFVLWIVPNEAIYTQTKKHLSNREHPYRQMLDKAAAGRVKILEKGDRLDRRDIDDHLCVMLLMLPAANRETQGTLRMFRDRGNVHGFFPDGDDFDAHWNLLEQIPNLSAYNNQDTLQKGSIIQDSLGNVLRFIRPVVVIDEGQKAFSKLAIKTVYGFNPCFVLELSATPKDRLSDIPPTYANWLVDVRGAELAREEMIKLPINLKVKTGDDWRDCLRESLEMLNRLQADSDKLHANTAIYIRPILLVQVERTGKEQREAGFIHANDAKEFLLTTGMSEREIAIKTSEVNDLKEPENLNLLSNTSPVRVIITKQALQEGWDCPFAYVLCSLATSNNLSAMTQLVGRILRQPYASKTQVEALDQCYVFCHHANTNDVVAKIKQGLEQDGMADLVDEIRESSGDGGNGDTSRKIPRRKGFESLEIFLPVVNRVDGSSVRALDYEQDVLLAVDWQTIDLAPLAKLIPRNVQQGTSQMTQITITDGAGGEFFPTLPTKAMDESADFDPVYATRIISDIVPNPWVARELVGKLLDSLKAEGFDTKKLGELSSLILEELRKYLMTQRDKLAEVYFFDEVAAARIQFRLRTDAHNWQMPMTMDTSHPLNAPKLSRKSGDTVERSLFAPAYKPDFNGDEEDFACYLDEQAALKWWHRNVAKSGQYFVQGWRKNKVYPDFIFAVARNDDSQKIVIIETKGDQLEGNLDTEYKRKLLQLVNDRYAFENATKAGEIELVLDDKTTVSCDLILMSQWATKLASHLA